MNLNVVIPAVAAVLLVVFGVYLALTPQGDRRPADRRPADWRFPALLMIAFTALSLRAIFAGGMFGFVPEHIRNEWGNQIIVDLIVCGATAYAALLPRVRAAGMPALPWFIAVAMTGSIGLLAMVARLLYLERGAHTA